MNPMGERSTHSRGLPLQPRVDRHCDRPAGAARPAEQQRLGRACRFLRQMNARGTSGAAAVEFALVSLAFISLMLLTIETGWQLLIESATNTGAMAASRMGSTGTTVAAGITPPPPDRDSSIRAVLIQNFWWPASIRSAPNCGSELRKLLRPHQRRDPRQWDDRAGHSQPGRPLHNHLYPALPDADSGGDRRTIGDDPHRACDRAQ